MLVGLGRDLGVDIVAEGLETSEAVAAIRGLGCDLAQGFHFSRPVSETEFRRLLNSTEIAPRRVA